MCIHGTARWRPKFLDEESESSYETHFGLGAGQTIPEENKSAELSQMYMPRPQFHTSPISKEKMEKEISQRSSKRKLCGW
jgi:hypothetical protein